MLGNLISNRGIRAGLVFFVLIVGGSLLYSWYIHRTTDAEVAETQRKVQLLENKDESHTTQDTVATSTVDLEQTETPLEDDEVQPMSDDTAAFPIDDTESDDLTDAFLPDDFVSEEEIVEDVPVSPYGFGPYPELPEGWSVDTFPAPSADHELMARVRLELLSQGVDVTGSTMENGLIYPTIKGTAYVKWKEYERPTGTVRYISELLATGEAGERLHTIRSEKGKSLTLEDIPADIQLVPFEDGAIDPYQFLDLP